MKKVVTYQTATGNKIDICQKCERERKGNWPKNDRGEEYATVSMGLHKGECDICKK